MTPGMAQGSMVETGGKDPAGAGAGDMQCQEGGSGLEDSAFELKFIFM